MMKLKVSTLFLIFAWVYHFGIGSNISSGIMLILSALYMMVDAANEWRDTHA